MSSVNSCNDVTFSDCSLDESTDFFPLKSLPIQFPPIITFAHYYHTHFVLLAKLYTSCFTTTCFLNPLPLGLPLPETHVFDKDVLHGYPRIHVIELFDIPLLSNDLMPAYIIFPLFPVYDMSAGRKFLG